MSDISYDPARHYDRVSAAWQMLLGDELHYGLFASATDSLAVATAGLTSRMIEQARLAPGMHVLDVGCGTGTQACQLARDLGVQVLGITTSAQGVGIATQRAADEGVTGVRFELRDGTDNRLPGNQFDCVWALESSHLMRDRDALLAESARVLRTGGRFVLCDLIRHRAIDFREVRARRADFATLREAFGDAHMETLDYYVAGLTRCGLSVDSVEDLTDATLHTFARWRANATAHRAEVSEAIGADGLAAFERSTDILEAFWRDGTLGYGLVAASKPATTTHFG